jgi:hypothetical protein
MSTLKYTAAHVLCVLLCFDPWQYDEWVAALANWEEIQESEEWEGWLHKVSRSEP